MIISLRTHRYSQTHLQVQFNLTLADSSWGEIIQKLRGAGMKKLITSPKQIKADQSESLLPPDGNRFGCRERIHHKRTRCFQPCYLLRNCHFSPWLAQFKLHSFYGTWKLWNDRSFKMGRVSRASKISCMTRGVDSFVFRFGQQATSSCFDRSLFVFPCEILVTRGGVFHVDTCEAYRVMTEVWNT